MNTAIKKAAIVRQDFLKSFIKTGCLNYNDAAKVYDAMSDLFADAVIEGQKISIGRVLSIRPVKRKARKVTMRMKGLKKTIYLSDRIVFKVNIYRAFLNKHQLDWRL